MVDPGSSSSEEISLATLEAHELFRGEDADILEDLVARSESMTLQPGDELFRQGDASDALYLVVSGSLEVEVARGDGPPILGRIDQGEPVGEMQILSGGERTATVRANTASRLVRMPREAFEGFISRSPRALTCLQTTVRRRLNYDRMARNLAPLFGDLDHEMIVKLHDRVEWLRLARGDRLFEQGDPGDSWFVVMGGRLKAVTTSEDGQGVTVCEIGVGESVGEMAVFTGEARAATVLAVRDASLMRFSKDAFADLQQEHPEVVMNICRQVIARLKRVTNAPAPAKSRQTSFAVIPLDPEVDPTGFCRRFERELAQLGPTLHLSRDVVTDRLATPGIADTDETVPENIRLTTWLEESEQSHTFVVYQADDTSSAWTRRCLKMADKILLIAHPTAEPTRRNVEKELLLGENRITPAAQNLILLHPGGGKLPQDTRDWLRERPLECHFHVRWDQDGDFARLARLLTGNGVGVVLGSGGARGFAHVGALRALREAGIPIDMIGGASIGSWLAAQYAMELSEEEILSSNRWVWNEIRPQKDYTLPLFSILGGRRAKECLAQVFGDTRIEDLWANYFCVTSSLTNAELNVHRSGLLRELLQACLALPGISPPVLRGEDLLVDGGVINNVPGDIMQDLCGESVIVIDVNVRMDVTMQADKVPSPWQYLASRFLPGRKRLQMPGLLEIVARSEALNSIIKANQMRRRIPLYLEPPIKDFGLFDFKAMDSITEVGYEYTKTTIAEWRANGLLDEVVQTGAPAPGRPRPDSSRQVGSILD